MTSARVRDHCIATNTHTERYSKIKVIQSLNQNQSNDDDGKGGLRVANSRNVVFQLEENEKNYTQQTIQKEYE